MKMDRAGARRAATTLLIGLALLWASLAVTERLAQPKGMRHAASVELLLPDADGSYDGAARLVQVPLHGEPGYRFTDATRVPGGRFRIAFDAKDDEPLALFLGWARRTEEVRLNGVILRAQASGETWGLFGGFEPVAYLLPPEALQPDGNLLTVEVSGRANKILPAFHVGPAAAVLAAQRWGRLFSIELPVAAIGVMAFALVLLLAAPWPPADRLRVRGVAVLLGAWILRNLSQLDFFDFIPAPWNLPFAYSVGYGFLAGAMLFALGWTGAPRWSFRATLAVAGLCMVVVIATAVLSTPARTFTVANFIETWLTSAIGLLAAAVVLRARYRSPETGGAAPALFLFCIAAIAVDSIDAVWPLHVPFQPGLPLTFYFAPMCGLVFALALSAILARQAAQARLLAVGLNDVLAARLAERSAELERSHARTREFERQVALAEERQRIVRDMHDGIGGQLTSLLLATRSQAPERGELEQALQDALDDLRLIVNSMESAGDTPAAAIARFRSRVEPRLNAAGVTMHWHVEQESPPGGLGPEAVLHVYRILQEACTNAVRHGGATRIDVRVDYTLSPPPRLSIRIEDNGRGPADVTAPHGTGLRNMRQRAARLGGTFDAGAAATGMFVALTVPVNPPAQPMEAIASVAR